MQFPTPDDPGEAPIWDNNVVAQAARAALRLIPPYVHAIGVEVQRSRIGLVVQVPPDAPRTDEDIDGIVGEMGDLLGPHNSPLDREGSQIRACQPAWAREDDPGHASSGRYGSTCRRSCAGGGTFPGGQPSKARRHLEPLSTGLIGCERLLEMFNGPLTNPAVPRDDKVDRAFPVLDVRVDVARYCGVVKSSKDVKNFTKPQLAVTRSCRRKNST